MSTIFISGSTGYIGTRLIRRLLERGHRVIALVRKGSEHKLPPGTEAVVADPFQSASFIDHIPAQSVFVQLLGVAHPSPKKAQQFRDIDLRSAKASADAASQAGVSNFIYVSVAMAPSSIMKVYQDVRRDSENYCRSKNLHCTFLRPWYALGPGHWWPILLLPVYGIAELVPSWRRKLRSYALVTIRQMLNALVRVVEQDAVPLRILEIKDIRRSGR